MTISFANTQTAHTHPHTRTRTRTHAHRRALTFQTAAVQWCDERSEMEWVRERERERRRMCVQFTKWTNPNWNEPCILSASCIAEYLYGIFYPQIAKDPETDILTVAASDDFKRTQLFCMRVQFISILFRGEIKTRERANERVRGDGC